MKRQRHTGLDRFGVLVAATLVGALAAAPAHASGGVSCSISTTSLAFGGYVPFSTVPTDVTATITVSCTATGGTTGTLLGTISLTSTSPSYSRQLTDGAYTLRYHTYQNPARTTFWGNGSGLGGTVAVSGSVPPGPPFQQTFTVYGRIPARQSSAHVGAYTDLITATLSY
jgi:spore coat protein U-like protein